MAAVVLAVAAGQTERQDEARATRDISGDLGGHDPRYHSNQLVAARPITERVVRDNVVEKRSRAVGDFGQILDGLVVRGRSFDELREQARLANFRAYGRLAIISDVGERRFQGVVVTRRPRHGTDAYRGVPTRRAHRTADAI